MKYLKLALATLFISGTGLVTTANAQAIEKVSVTTKVEMKSAVESYAKVVKNQSATIEAVNQAFENVQKIARSVMAEGKANIAAKGLEDGPEMKKYQKTVNLYNEMIIANRGADKAKVLTSMKAFVDLM